MILNSSTNWLRFALLLALVLQLPAADLQFEVASVKPNHSDPGNSAVSNNTSTGSLTLQNVTLIALISRAYNTKTWQIIGPDWLPAERYDIDARAGRPLQPGEMGQMLQALLAERFHLAVHRETRDLRGYDLVATTMPKLQSAPEDGHSSLNSSNGHMVAQHDTLAQFAAALAGEIKAPVRDQTRMSGRFNFTLDFSSELSSGPDRTDSSDAPSVFTALEQQLGLKLEAVRAPFEVIVIDHADKLPVEN